MNGEAIILTVENAPNVMSVRNRENPEWGAFRFNYNAQRLTEGYCSTIGSGSDSRVLPWNEYGHWEVASLRSPYKDEESRKSHALEGLAELASEMSGECVTLGRERGSAKLCVNGEVLERFSIGGDSPLMVLFDAMQAVMRHKRRIL
jgi:hypothetical protein